MSKNFNYVKRNQPNKGMTDVRLIHGAARLLGLDAPLTGAAPKTEAERRYESTVLGNLAVLEAADLSAFHIYHVTGGANWGAEGLAPASA